MTGSTGHTVGHRADIQGLRGIAVLLVVIFHAGYGLSGGFIGVDVFFVISGFVIGASMLRELEAKQRINLARFYFRRVRRLLPALALMLTVVLLLAPLFAAVASLAITRRTGIAAALINANTYLSQVSVDYFAPSAELNPLLHTWSLSVEEQFYLVFPLVFTLSWWTARRLGKSGTTGVLIVLGLAAISSFLLSTAWVDGRAENLALGSSAERAAFFSMPSRAWEFVCGLMLALAFRKRSMTNSTLASALSISGLALVVWGAITFDEATMFPGPNALIPVVGTVAILAGGTCSTVPTLKLMASRPLQGLGNLSYSWYLWHWPVIVFARSLWPSAWWVGPIAAVASLGPAAFSYSMVETKYRFSANASMRSTAALAAACVAIPLAAGALNAFASSRGSVESFTYLTRPHIDQTSGCVSPQPLGDRDANDCTWNKVGTGPEAVLIGDSNAGHLSEAFIESASSYGYSATIASMPGCPFVQLNIRDISGPYDECRRFVDASVDHLLATSPDVVFLASSGSYVESDVYQLSADGVHWAGSVHDRAMLWEQGQADLSQKLASAGVSVVLVHAVPKLPDWDPRRCAAIRWDFGATWCSASISRTAAIAQSANVRNAEVGAARRGDAQLLDLFDAVCPGVRCSSMRDGILVYSDGVHLTVDTARWLTPVFRDVFSSLGHPADT